MQKKVDMDQLTNVSAAVIKNGDKVLLCQRPKGKRHELLWEFPGGKIEPNETEEDCVIREIQEELDVTLGNLKNSLQYKPTVFLLPILKQQSFRGNSK